MKDAKHIAVVILSMIWNLGFSQQSRWEFNVQSLDNHFAVEYEYLIVNEKIIDSTFIRFLKFDTSGRIQEVIEGYDIVCCSEPPSKIPSARFYDKVYIKFDTTKSIRSEIIASFACDYPQTDSRTRRHYRKNDKTLQLLLKCNSLVIQGFRVEKFDSNNMLIDYIESSYSGGDVDSILNSMANNLRNNSLNIKGLTVYQDADTTIIKYKTNYDFDIQETYLKGRVVEVVENSIVREYVYNDLGLLTEIRTKTNDKLIDLRRIEYIKTLPTQ